MSIPGPIIGGFLADHSKNVRAVFSLPWAVFGLALLLVAFLGMAGVWIMVLIGGLCVQFGFAAWSAIHLPLLLTHKKASDAEYQGSKEKKENNKKIKVYHKFDSYSEENKKSGKQYEMNRS
jgi:hypothetical protein